ncbi:MAG: peptidylprolyl isomerase [Gammaproteobacteria bacterium]|nr:peptidylprolyl isomerase [Gammaproteobacteria bacterium]
MNKFYSLFIVGSLTFTINISLAEENNTKILAEVNGSKITTNALQRYQKRRGIPGDASPKQQRQMMIDELINRELIFQDALKVGLDKDIEIMAELDVMRKNLLASAMLRNITTTVPISDEDLKKEYHNRTKDAGTQEYKARHILLTEETEAKEVIKSLSTGAEFAELAKQKSTGPSGTEGGDLGWFKPHEMVKPFSDAVANLKNGEFTKTAVKSDFGWHVILREDARVIPPPPFESVKEQLRMRLQNKQIEQYIATLRKNATIEHKQ